jgi:indolepyruvate decarboxylase
MPKKTTVGGYLIHRLEELGVKDIFGVPGDYVLGFYDLLVESDLNVVGTCTEAGAGFATDAYARINGLGAVCITYCVGGLNTLNSVAGAYAEKSPMIVISGAPGLDERARSPLLHHKVRDFDTQKQIFENVTVASVAIEDAESAPRLIDKTIDACLRHKRPVYIELPRDMVSLPCAAPKPWKKRVPKSDKEALDEAVAEAAAMLRSAKRPVILAGVEIHRFSLQNDLLRLVEKTGYPIAATLLGKSVVRESHPQYLGIYEGAIGREDVRKTVERADCVLILGAFMTDINLGIYTAQLDVSRTINAISEGVSIKHHLYKDVKLKHFVDSLTRAKLGPKKKATLRRRAEPKPFKPRKNRPLSVARFFARMNDYLGERNMVICDIGDCLFGAADLVIQKQTEFISPAYYTSMGFAIPATLGAQMRKRHLRPIVFVGDGAFQMTCQELSTIVRHGLNPIIFVLNNKGYSTERFINDGPYNDIHDWAYHKWPELLRAGWGAEAHTEGELEEHLTKATKNTKSLSIINLHLDPYDRSQAMGRLGKRLSERIKPKK